MSLVVKLGLVGSQVCVLRQSLSSNRCEHRSTFRRNSQLKDCSAMVIIPSFSATMIRTVAVLLVASLVSGFKLDKSETSASRLNLGAPGEGTDIGGSDRLGREVETRGKGLKTSSKQRQTPEARKAVNFSWNLWLKRGGIPIIPYTLDGKDSYPTFSNINQAMAHIESNTCIRFQEIDGFYLGNRLVFSDGGCYSPVGRQFLNIFGTRVYVDSDCSDMNSVVRLLGHSIGLYHEQSRSDRDSHVEILSDNVHWYNRFRFDRLWFTNNYDTEYDYYSIMHFGPLAYSRNGGTTVSATDPMAQGLMAVDRQGLSFMDKLIMNKMYGCDDYWRSSCNMNSDPCQNSGYVGSDCDCVCRPGTSGEVCQNVEKSYLDALKDELLPNNAVITLVGFVTTPLYPIPQTAGTTFTKMIVAPSCFRIVLTVIEFEMSGRCSNNVCCEEGLEVRAGDLVTSGEWYCGTEVSLGNTFTSTGNTMALFYLKTEMQSNPNAGFNFGITFEPIIGCK